MGNFVLLDTYNLMYRAFHGNKTPLTAPDGTPTNAVFTIIKMINNLKNKIDFKHGAAIFDGGGPTFRDEITDDYKANRKPMPDELKIQVPIIKEGLALLGWPIWEADGVEADDVTGTLAIFAENKGQVVYILSGDKDFRAIVSDKIMVMDTMNNIVYDRQTVFDKMGVWPEQVKDYLTLLGDSVDNVAGVDGCGPKTAVKWLSEYGDIKTLLLNAHHVKGKVGDSLRTAVSSGHLAKAQSLISLKTDVPLNITSDRIWLADKDNDLWQSYCEKYNLRSLMNPLPTISARF